MSNVAGSSIPAPRAAVIGEESLMIQCVDILRDHGVEVVAVASQSDAIHEWAATADIPALVNDSSLTAGLASFSFDYLFSITNLRVLPAELLEQATAMAVNFHDGPLPAYAGLYATTWALLGAEAEHGVTWHTMEAAVDEGEILEQVRFPIASDETAYTLNVKCYEHAISSFAQLVAQLVAGSADRTVQDLSGRSYFGRDARPEAAATLRWDQPAADIARGVRALDFGATQPNPLAHPKVWLGDTLALVESVDVDESASGEPGTVLALDAGTATIAAATGAVVLSTLTTIDGDSVPAADALRAAGFASGATLPIVDQPRADRLTALVDRLAPAERRWRRELTDAAAPDVPYARPAETAGPTPLEHLALDFTSAVTAHLQSITDPVGALVGGFACFLGRLGGSETFHLSLASDEIDQLVADLAPWFSERVPVRCDLSETESVGVAVDAVAAAFAASTSSETHVIDLGLRVGELGSAPAALAVGIDVRAGERPPAALELCLDIDPTTTTCGLRYDPAVYSGEAMARLAGQFATFADGLWSVDEPDRRLHEIPLLSPDQEHEIVAEWNDTATPIDTDTTLHAMVAARAQSMPDSPALTYDETTLSYAELEQRSNQLAHALRSAGADAGRCVGIHMTRGLDMVVALLGVLKSGAAYVPLDPTYPHDRVAFMANDARIAVLLTESSVAASAPDHPGSTIVVDAEAATLAQQPTTPLDTTSGPDDLAYVIYTSGSTGRPKGVMVTHRNAVNFLGGMDEIIDHKPGDKWLTVTSLSFDISVLEIFWSLTHGLELVVYGEGPAGDGASTGAHSSREIDFSLFYFASDEGGADGAEKYRLLLDGARFADEHGFAAVWTPERHFHAFGGLYPNPAVSSAALASITENIEIRAGSCVLPLHHPARVAEEWAVVDNLSNGRVGIAFAAGWQPVDFLLRPESFEDRKTVMMNDIETVRSLWRGETVHFEGPTGPADIRTMPRPIQPELPTWLTVAGNPETFRMAGEAGFGVLTHLLGQTLEDVKARIDLYREARRAAGHEGDGHIVLMLHTYVGDDIESVKDLVRGPMIDYLGSSVSLIREAAWTFPTITQRSEETGQSPGEVFDQQDLSQDELDALLEHSFNRYFHGSALFGTVDSCLSMVDDLKGIGVDEIACQIDFGVPTDAVFESLPLLDEIRRRSMPSPAVSDKTIAELIEQHGITHFQCTPSMGSMLVADDAFRKAAKRLDHCLMGGEAFSPALAQEITEIVDGSVVNVYGPTETTIWSSTQPVIGGDGPVFIGRPLANQQMYIVDERLRPVPVGVPGELLIGGDGVTKGYLDRPELTAERFIADHFRPDRPGARLYRTGDLARYNADGTIDFLGRMDFQVKLRGYRIELGEIEARLTEHPSVREAVCTVREDTPGDQRLIGYVIPAGDAIDDDAVLAHVAEHVPEFMVPSVLVELDAFPLTPNKKTDRGALPAPEARAAVSQAAYAPAEDDTQRQIVELWQRLLGVTQVGIDDNFFDLGGHSLLAVTLHRELKDTLEAEVSITDVFRFPTISSFTAHLRDREGAQEEARAKVADRASARRAAMAGRRPRRSR